MKLLLDQNLSPRLVTALQGAHPGSAHVREFAKKRGFVIDSKDGDFHQMSFVLGASPKVIWLRVGNCSSQGILERMQERVERLEVFERDEEAGLLVLP